MVASVEGPVEAPDPSSSSSSQLSFAECRQAARSVRRAEHGGQALAAARPRDLTGLYRERPPPTVLLYLLGRQNLVVWRSPDEFVALGPPDATTMTGHRPAVRPHWLDRRWNMLVEWLPPFSALLLAVCLIVPAERVPTLSLTVLLLVLAAILHTIVIMLAPPLYWLVSLCRRLAGSVPGRHETTEQLIAQNWSISLCHVTDPTKAADILRAARERVGDAVAAAEAGQATDSTVTLVCNERCITTSAVRDAVCAAAGTTRIAEVGVELLILREPGDESVPRFDASLTNPARFLGLYFFAIAILLAGHAHIVAGTERAACAPQCDGRPARYGDALYWLLSHLVLRGDPGDLSPVTAEARLSGLLVAVLGVTTIGVVVAAGVQTVRARTKNAQEFERRTRCQLDSSARATWGSVFINYRQGMADQGVAALHRTLAERLAPAKVFFDVRSIPPGGRYPDDLRDALDASTVLITVIQKGWLDRLNERRNVTGTDWVRFEIATALSAGKTIIPVLFDDVAPPKAEQLLDDIADLAHRQAYQLRWNFLAEDTNLFIAVIETHLRSAAESRSRPHSI